MAVRIFGSLFVFALSTAPVQGLDRVNSLDRASGLPMGAESNLGATGMAGHAHFAKTGERSFWVGIDLHAAMLSNQKGGVLIAESRVVRAGRRVTVIRTVVRGEGGKALVDVTTTHVPT